MNRKPDKQAEKIAYLTTIGWQVEGKGPTGCILMTMTNRQIMIDARGVVTERGIDYAWYAVGEVHP